MKIAVYGRPKNQGIQKIEECLRASAVDYQINPDNTKGYTIALSVGGDGTFLSAVRSMGHQLIPILGINSGRLGFLASVAMSDISQALEAILNGKYTLQNRLMIGVDGGNVQEKSNRALNEFSIQKSGTSMINIEVEIAGEAVAKYWADGVIVSTPTGSTAYSMSVGGAILSPDCQCLILSPIAPHNLNIRPLVVPATNPITIKVTTRGECENAIATIDNREVEAPSGTTYTIMPCTQKLQEIVLQGHSFYNTLRDKLLWGVDLRN